MKWLLFASALAFGSSLFVLLYYRLSFRDRCPVCKQRDSFERVPRPTAVRAVLFYLPIQYYVCYSCISHFIRIKS
ncbi:hypothetical protein FHK02_1776 [Spirosoma sp. LMG 31448]|uniref:Uncharacterized protein n=1 Tax=Spirosoma utsteinense TaxID=2585773 RepID=A0ABR6WBD2_9BACT|nr:hypothetical protein [Spirosoma utsteinense]MBC3793875.1 hypothetical protein [Spirosoma utsteinense]